MSPRIDSVSSVRMFASAVRSVSAAGGRTDFKRATAKPFFTGTTTVSPDLTSKRAVTTARDGEAVAAALSRAVVAALFDVEPGETVVVPVKDGFAVARLKSVLPPAAETDRTAEANIRTELTELMRGDILAQFAAAMRDRYPVRINPRALESL